jgi:hypothetical protein
MEEGEHRYTVENGELLCDCPVSKLKGYPVFYVLCKRHEGDETKPGPQR